VQPPEMRSGRLTLTQTRRGCVRPMITAACSAHCFAGGQLPLEQRGLVGIPPTNTIARQCRGDASGMRRPLCLHCKRSPHSQTLDEFSHLTMAALKGTSFEIRYGCETNNDCSTMRRHCIIDSDHWVRRPR